MLDSKKAHFWFWRKTPQKLFFFVFWFWFRFRSNRCTNVLLFFFCALSKNTDRNKFCESILLFLKLKQNKKMNTILLKVFISKRKNALFQGSTIFRFFIFWGFYFKKNKRTNVVLARLRLKFCPHNSRKL